MNLAKSVREVGLAIAALAACACGDQVAETRAQWTVVVSTDAQVPQFGDRLLVELMDDAGQLACAGCRRQLGAQDAASWPMSFGVTPEPGAAPPHVRVRLFRTEMLEPGGMPTGVAQIDTLATLPAAQVGADQAVSVALDMRCFGVPADVSGKKRCDPDTGILASEQEAPAVGESTLLTVGSWEFGRRDAACEGIGDPKPAMACVQGGAFLLGLPRNLGVPGIEAEPIPEHLVHVDSFLIDKSEFTVGAFRAVLSADPHFDAEPTGNNPQSDAAKYCTYLGRANAANDATALNCITHELATRVCASIGKRLPTEAEWEYAAGNLDLETAYPWGNQSDDLCARAVVSRDELHGNMICRDTPGGMLGIGPAPPGSTTDRTATAILDMAGNLSEWVADAFADYGQVGSCWDSGGRLMVNPRCDPLASEPTPLWTCRGGNWRDAPVAARICLRRARAPGGADTIGFRCAQSL